MREAIRNIAFATIITTGEGKPEANHIPFLLKDGKLTGHFARANPVWKSISGAEALVVFMGPHFYTSPNWYPSKAVTILVAYAPGGQGDLFARMVSEKLTLQMKQSFVVENKPGVSGTVGTRLAVQARKDGYTLFLGQTGEIVVNRVLMKDLGYDPLKELVPVVLVGNAPLVMLACILGVYSMKGSVFDLVVMLTAGVVGYFLRKADYDLTPFLLAFVLGDRMEVALRRGLIITDGDWWALAQAAVSKVFIGALVLLALLQGTAWLLGYRRRMAAEEAAR